jgi:geranylgeranyl diphosphate synthase type I
MNELRAKLFRYQSLLDRELAAVLTAEHPFDELYAMMAYHLGWLDEQLLPRRSNQGKRLRPVLSLLVCESVGGSPETGVHGAVALELVHNFSLVHDDVEDTSATRRHRPTVWALWGVPHGINVGDGMFALGYAALCRADLTPDRRQAALGVLAGTCLELCEGQFLDLRLQQQPAGDAQRYFAMISRKTGSMFDCAARLGGLLGGADEAAVGQLGEFGRNLGEAFQMRDDVLGVWGDETVTGKPTDDIRNRKYGLPVAIACDTAESADVSRLRALYGRPARLADADVRWVQDLFDRLGVRQRAELAVREKFNQTAKLLDDTLPESQATRSLREFVGYLSDRAT